MTVLSQSRAMKTRFGSSLFRVRLLRLGLAICGLMATAQSMAFLNVVGYVNVVLTNGYAFVANPLNATYGNSIANVIPSPPDGTRVWLWNVTNQAFDAPAKYVDTNTGWTLNLSLP